MCWGRGNNFKYLHAGIPFVGTICFVSSLWQSWGSNLGPCMCLEQHWVPLVNMDTRAPAPALEHHPTENLFFCILVAQYSWQEANWLWADPFNPNPISLICTPLLNPATSFDYCSLYLMWDEGSLWSSVPSHLNLKTAMGQASQKLRSEAYTQCSPWALDFESGFEIPPAFLRVSRSFIYLSFFSTCVYILRTV